MDTVPVCLIPVSSLQAAFFKKFFVSPGVLTHPFGLNINGIQTAQYRKGYEFCPRKEKVGKGRNRRATSFDRKRADGAFLVFSMDFYLPRSVH